MEAQQQQNELYQSLGRVEGQLSSLVNVVGSLSGDIKTLSNDFATMEKGRLTKLEVNFATLKTEMQIKGRNTAMLISAGISIGITVIAQVIIALVFHVKL